VLDHLVCSYTPNLAALLGDSRPNLDSTHVLALGGGTGLKQTIREAEAVALAWRPRRPNASVQVLTGEGITLEMVQENLKNAQVAHFACHGVQDLSSPLKSKFSISESLDIELEELMKGASPDARLAVLLACETAQGKSISTYLRSTRL
jgi:CHAT domain-containing protein